MESLKQFVEEKINHYAQSIVTGTDKQDQWALGELQFYMSLRSVINGGNDRVAMGMLDAVNDTLQHLGIISKEQSFYKK